MFRFSISSFGFDVIHWSSYVFQTISNFMWIWVRLSFHTNHRELTFPYMFVQCPPLSIVFIIVFMVLFLILYCMHQLKCWRFRRVCFASVYALVDYMLSRRTYFLLHSPCLLQEVLVIFQAHFGRMLSALLCFSEKRTVSIVGTI